MQANAQQVQDDLANLFSRNLTFNPDFHVSAQKDTLRQEPAPLAPVPQPIVYSISQHYHHSAHTAKAAAQPYENHGQCQPQRPSSEPPQSELSPMEMTLRSYGIDPAVLTPSQVQLFRIADDPQKLRLLELWSICPPSRAEDIPSLAWSSTTLDQEEHLAKMRYERQHNPAMSLDGTQVQTADGKWTQHMAAESEPYMTSGYEELMRREYERQSVDNKARDVYNHYGTAVGSDRYTRSNDPVYKGPDYDQQQQHSEMAAQYGAFEQLRNASMPSDAMDFM
ncbi:uncharacterized protein MAM_01907 [Metarhizium album ARSEF 1941]|uniref:Uncharacterized protein n=1 Tax=Metarhizium album (strain ARSEF 1941) TaxID=1081103 RepID=A0A0B2X0Y9_METAS|nr:uncharacterized protein MAM_01907 [Metarhizium album ARSEF 1941]KHN99983.1 hypothetical protein MAM_01907 [Metarhizium album ARSEF 1941]